MSPALIFKPVTDETVSDFQSLFGAPGAPKYCWCMTWRASSDELKDTKSASRQRQMLGRIAEGVPVGLLAYLAGVPVAWVSVAPKQSFRGLGGPEDDLPVWSLTCMYVAKAQRKTGLSAALITAAAQHAKAQGAAVLEAYPVAPDSPSYRFMGFVPAFERLGFAPVGTAGKRRHVMRLGL
ncbi:GNAT family N-acetyltransferase [Devosia sp. A449]